MKMVTVEALTLGEAWWKCLDLCLKEGYEYTIDKGSFAGQKRKEFDYISIRVSEPGIRPIVPDVPVGVPAPTTMDYVEQDYLPYLMSGAKTVDEEYTYGWYLESQIQGIIPILRNYPNTNQAYMTVGDPSTLLMKDPPCLRGIQCRVRYGALHFEVYFRSWDLWGGFCSNLAGLQLMKEYMADAIGVADGEMIASSGGLHLYDHAWELAKIVVGDRRR